MVMTKKRVPNVHFKGVMGDYIEANWNAVKKIYGEGDPNLPMAGHECTCFFHGLKSLDNITQKYIMASL